MATMVQAFALLRPFEETFRQDLKRIEGNGIKLAELTEALQGALINIRRIASDAAALEELEGADKVVAEARLIAADTHTTAQTLTIIVERQAQQVSELNASTMNLKEAENDPHEIGDLIIDVTTVIANWKTLIQYDVDLLIQSLLVALPPYRKEALSRLPKAAIIEWFNDILAVALQHNIDLLIQSLLVAPPDARREALSRLPKNVARQWLNDLQTVVSEADGPLLNPANTC